MDWIYQADLAGLRLLNVSGDSPYWDTFFRIATCFGTEWLLIPLLSPLILFPAYRRWGLSCYLAIFSSGLLTQLFKHLTARLRPGFLPGTSVASDEPLFYGSFPSGHTAVCFAAATAFALGLHPRYQRWVLPLVLLLSFLVGISRIYRGVHWPTDVAGGAFLGFASGILWSLLIFPSQKK